MSKAPDELIKERIARDRARERAREILGSMTDEEDAALVRAAELDHDNPPIPPGTKLVTPREARRRGRPRVPSPKRQVTLRLDGEVVDGMRALGEGWQVRVNAVLKEWLKKAS
jgi:uncharacterized protein (DUF4415 family)